MICSLSKILKSLDLITTVVSSRFYNKKIIISRKSKKQYHALKKLLFFIKEDQIKKMIWVKTKELILWLCVIKMYNEYFSSKMITSKINTGGYNSFQVSAFQLE